MFTMMSEERYEKECDEGAKICVMCGQHNKKEQHNCWYCGAREVAPMAEHGSIRSTNKLPVTRADGSYTVDTMKVGSMKEFNERVEAFKLATKETT